MLSQLPFHVETIQTDNGAEFQSAFHWHVLDQGIDHVYIKPRSPRLNGKVERSHHIDAEEFYRLLDGIVIDDINIFNTKLQEWQDYYNYHRPHGGLNGQTPYERLRQKTQSREPGVADQRQSHKTGVPRHNEHAGLSRYKLSVIMDILRANRASHSTDSRRMSLSIRIPEGSKRKAATAVRDESIMALRREGKSLKAIAAEVDCSTSAVSSGIKKHS